MKRITLAALLTLAGATAAMGCTNRFFTEIPCSEYQTGMELLDAIKEQDRRAGIYRTEEDQQADRLHRLDQQRLAEERALAASAAARARDREWMERCKPIAQTDPDGIRRYQYARPDCP